MQAENKIYQMLREKGCRVTAQKRLIIGLFLAHRDKMLSVAEMAGLLPEGARIDNATLYRNVQKFEKFGLIEVMVDDRGVQRYMIFDGDHHHHFICTSCGHIINFPCGIPFWRGLADKHRFVEQYHRIEVFGVCAACSGT